MSTALRPAPVDEHAEGVAPRGLPAGPPLPMPVQTLLWMLLPVRFTDVCMRRYGDIFTVRLPYNGTVVQVCHPDGVRAVFGADPASARAGEANRVLLPVLGRRSVLLLDGAEHLRQRRLMLPAFHGERMQRYGAIIEEVTRLSIATWPLGRPFALRQPMQAITLEVILRAVFGAEGTELEELQSRLVTLLRTQPQLAMLPWFQHDPGGRALTPWGRFLRRRDAADRSIYTLIARRRAEQERGEAKRDDILSLLLRARDERGDALTDAELRDELMTLLLAGHETTATSLAWFFELMLRHPVALRRLEAEIAAGASLDYLDAAIKEALRLRPTVPVVARVLHAELEVMGHRLPKRSAVAANIMGVHRNPRVHEAPDEFRPERFLGTRADVFSWLPFGGGVRRCLGASFATYEMRTVIPVVLRSLALSATSERAERQVRRAVTLVPHRGSRVVACRRPENGAAQRAAIRR